MSEVVTFRESGKLEASQLTLVSVVLPAGSNDAAVTLLDEPGDRELLSLKALAGASVVFAPRVSIRTGGRLAVMLSGTGAVCSLTYT